MDPTHPYNPALPMFPDWRPYALLMVLAATLFAGGFLMTRENVRRSILEGSGMMVASLALLISLTGAHLTAAGSDFTYLWAGVLFAGAIGGSLLAFRIQMEQQLVRVQSRLVLCAATHGRRRTYR